MTHTTSHPIILFDGICHFCNGTVNFIIRQDKKDMFRFTPLQSAKAKELLQQHKLAAQHFDSFVLIQNGKAFVKSTAGLKVYNQLPWYWKWTQIFWVVPRFIRDAVYDWIAKNRYRWFGKRDSCMMPDEKLKCRFL